MKKINFETLESAKECYGENNLIAITVLKQIIFYIQQGVQPKFISENEDKPGKITCWFLRSETSYVYNKWLANRPKDSEKIVKK